MKKLILLIDPDLAFHQWMKDTFPQDLFILESAASGREGLDLALHRKPDLALLEWNLPGWGGLELCKALKTTKETSHIPLIMLTAFAQTQRKLMAFQMGIDDYLTKPFEMPELAARIKAVLRRFGPVPDNIAHVAGIMLNMTAYTAEVDGRSMRLTATEFGLLHMLIKNAGRILTRKHLLERIWGYAEDVSTRTVDVYIRRLRQKLGPKRAASIESIHGIGYKFKAPATSAAPNRNAGLSEQDHSPLVHSYLRNIQPAFSS